MKKNNKMPRTKAIDSERETGVLLEEIRKEVKIIAEGHSALSEKLGEVDTVVRKIDSNYFKLYMDTEAIKSQTGAIDIKIDRIERELGTVKNAVMDISNVTKDHDKRITKLEEKVLV